MKKVKFINIIFGIWLIAVIVLSVIPKTPQTKIATRGFKLRLDYAEHFLAYFILGMLFMMKRRRAGHFKNQGLTMVYTLWILFAISNELIQKFIAGRSFNPNDMYFNIGGMVVGLATTKFCIERQQKFANSSSVNN